MMIGKDFNLVRSAADKSNDIVNHKGVDLFNDWIYRWALIDINHRNRKFTQTNNQDDLVRARYRVFASTLWEAAFPMARVKPLDRIPSDHNHPLVDSRDNMFFGKKRFRFEKCWLEQSFWTNG